MNLKKIVFWLAAWIAMAGIAPGAIAADAPEGAAAKDLTIVAPSQNTDGSELTDLVSLVLYHCIGTGCTPNQGAETIPATAGQTVQEPYNVQLVGNYGDVVTVRYGATAIDSQGTESALSNVLEESWRITKLTGPQPPTLQFTVPISHSCVTPEGETCGLERVVI